MSNDELNRLNEALGKLKAAIEHMKPLETTLSADQFNASMAPLYSERDALENKIAEVKGSGAIAQGDDAMAVGKGGSITIGGIHSKKIKAANVVDGMQVQGGDAETIESLLKFAKDIQGKGIHADEIDAKNVISGFQYISDIKKPTVEELQKEIAAFQKSVLELIKSGEIMNKADSEDLADSMKKATREICEKSPRKGRIIRSLKGATEILEESAKSGKSRRKPSRPNHQAGALWCDAL